MTSVRFLEEAAEELKAATEFYDEEAPGLGRILVLEVQKLTESIVDNPYIGSRVRPNIRRRALRRFPYYILYSIEANDVLVVAVAHHRRAPGYWEDRV